MIQDSSDAANAASASALVLKKSVVARGDTPAADTCTNRSTEAIWQALNRAFMASDCSAWRLSRVLSWRAPEQFTTASTPDRSGSQSVGATSFAISRSIHAI